MWVRTRDFLDPDFTYRFASELPQRYWELWLACLLLERGFELEPKQKSQGPDFHIRLDGKDVWIEAAVPGEGTGTDSVPSIYASTGIDPLPVDKIILRFTNSIKMKLDAWVSYVKSGAVRAADPFVIAVNGGGIELAQFEDPVVPIIVRAVYPVGNLKVVFDPSADKVVSEGLEHRAKILKAGGSAVPTGTFLDPAYSGISGVLYARTSVHDLLGSPDESLVFVHNLAADAPLPVGWAGPGAYWEWRAFLHVTSI